MSKVIVNSSRVGVRYYKQDKSLVSWMYVFNRMCYFKVYISSFNKLFFYKKIKTVYRAYVVYHFYFNIFNLGLKFDLHFGKNNLHESSVK